MSASIRDIRGAYFSAVFDEIDPDDFPESMEDGEGRS